MEKLLLYVEKNAIMYGLFHTKELLAILSLIFEREIATKNFIFECKLQEFCSKWSSREHTEESFSWGGNGEAFTNTKNANIHLFYSQVNDHYFVTPYTQSK